MLVIVRQVTRCFAGSFKVEGKKSNVRLFPVYGVSRMLNAFHLHSF